MLPGQSAHRWGSACLPPSCHHCSPRGRGAKLGGVHAGGLGHSMELPRAVTGSGGCRAKGCRGGGRKWRCPVRGAWGSTPALRH